MDSTETQFALPAPGTTRATQVKQNHLLQGLQRTTPARIGVGRCGPRPPTEAMLAFRADHAAAVDAVFSELDTNWMVSSGLLVVDTLACDRQTYIRRPDLGRRLAPEAAKQIAAECLMQPQVQIVVSNGLSSQAIENNFQEAYKALCQSLERASLNVGTPLYVRNGRVAVMDEIGEIVRPQTLVLLIGERPGLVAADSMSAYLCYRPHLGTVEADRMVVSNIHKRGIPPAQAGEHLGKLLQAMMERKASGIHFTAGYDTASPGIPSGRRSPSR